MPTRDTAAIVEKLCDMAGTARHGELWAAAVFDYTATLVVYDVEDTGRVVVVWTATMSVPEPATEGWADIVAELRDAAFRDSVDELRRQSFAGAVPARADASVPENARSGVPPRLLAEDSVVVAGRRR